MDEERDYEERDDREPDEEESEDEESDDEESDDEESDDEESELERPKYEKRDDLIHMKFLKKGSKLHEQLIGLFAFLLIFVILIPIWLYKNKHFETLEAYMPNVNLIANLITFHTPESIDKYISELYASNPETLYSFISKRFFLWIALLGITYIIARETRLTKSIIKGWSIGFVMLGFTYLLGDQIHDSSMENTYDSLDKHSESVRNTASIIVGIIAILGIIYLEKTIIRNLRKTLIKLGKNIISFPKSF